LKFAIDIIRGIRVLHSNGIIHGDIKPQNILIFGDTAKLCDFGSAKAIYATAAGLSTLSGATYGFEPPEYGDDQISEMDELKGDIYAFGGLLLFMFSGFMPWQKNSETPEKHLKKLLKAYLAEENYFPDQELKHVTIYFNEQGKEMIGELIVELIKNCMKTKLSERMSLNQILKSLKEIMKLVDEEHYDKKDDNRKEQLDDVLVKILTALGKLEYGQRIMIDLASN
jgi:serine/threonine protein kinase